MSSCVSGIIKHTVWFSKLHYVVEADAGEGQNMFAVLIMHAGEIPCEAQTSHACASCLAKVYFSVPFAEQILQINDILAPSALVIINILHRNSDRYTIWLGFRISVGGSLSSICSSRA